MPACLSRPRHHVRTDRAFACVGIGAVLGSMLLLWLLFPGVSGSVSQTVSVRTDEMATNTLEVHGNQVVVHLGRGDGSEWSRWYFDPDEDMRDAGPIEALRRYLFFGDGAPAADSTSSKTGDFTFTTGGFEDATVGFDFTYEDDTPTTGPYRDAVLHVTTNVIGEVTSAELETDGHVLAIR